MPNTDLNIDELIDQIRWNADGLVPAIAQDAASGDVLMMAWMNKQSLALSIEEQRAIYWSRSRASLWRKGEESGNVQKLVSLRIDCDKDAVLMKVEQIGGIACHTGRRSCFYFELEKGQWQAADPVLKDPKDLYKR